MTIFDELHSGELYLPSDTRLIAEQTACLEHLYDFNHTRPSETEKRQQLLKKMFATIGDNVYIEPPLHANWGGKFCHLGNNVYVNFNLTLVDDTCIDIGDNTMIDPNVTIATAGHPIAPELRQQGYQYNRSISIGKNCWIGANSTILPGVSIGDNTVIGAGSLVTKNIPANCLAYGSPAKVRKTISDT